MPDRDLPLQTLLGFLLAVVLSPVFYPVANAIQLCVGILVGWLVGFRFAYGRTGPLLIYRRKQGVRLRRNPCARTDWYRENAFFVMATLSKRAIAYRIVLFQICLPLSIFLVGLGIFAPTIYLALTERPLWVHVLLLVPLGVSLWLLINAPQYLVNTMRIIRTMRAGGGAAASLSAQTALIAAEYVLAQRPRDWDASWIEQVTAPVDGEPQDACALWAYDFALDRGDVDAARSHIRKLVPDISVDKEPDCEVDLYEAAYFAARHDNDPATARAYLEKARGLCRIEDQTWLRAEAAVLLAEGKHQEAAARAREGLVAAQDAVHNGTLKAEVD